MGITSSARNNKRVRRFHWYMNKSGDTREQIGETKAESDARGTKQRQKKSHSLARYFVLQSAVRKIKRNAKSNIRSSLFKKKQKTSPPFSKQTISAKQTSLHYKLLQSVQSAALRIVLGAFRTTPVWLSLCAEAPCIHSPTPWTSNLTPHSPFLPPLVLVSHLQGTTKT